MALGLVLIPDRSPGGRPAARPWWPAWRGPPPPCTRAGGAESLLARALVALHAGLRRGTSAQLIVQALFRRRRVLHPRGAGAVE